MMVSGVCGPSKITMIILDDKKIIGYRPRLNIITGGVISTIILCQGMYWAKAAGNPFYKFKLPCGHRSYKPGDSWCEELGLTRTEFDTGLKRIGQRIGKNVSADKEAFVWYWTDMDKITHYQINWERVNKMLSEAYEIDNSFIDNEKQESCFSESRNPAVVKAGKLILEKEESCIVYNEPINTTINTQSLSSSTSTVLSYAIDYLKAFGLDDDEINGIVKKHKDIFIVEKAKDISGKIALGEIENVVAYVKKTFGQPRLYTPAEEKLIMDEFAEEKQRFDMECKMAVDNAREAQKHAEFIERTDELIAHLSPTQLKEFEKYIQTEKKVLIKLYQEHGIKSTMILAELRSWVIKKEEL